MRCLHLIRPVSKRLSCFLFVPFSSSTIPIYFSSMPRFKRWHGYFKHLLNICALFGGNQLYLYHTIHHTIRPHIIIKLSLCHRYKYVAHITITPPPLDNTLHCGKRVPTPPFRTMSSSFVPPPHSRRVIVLKFQLVVVRLN